MSTVYRPPVISQAKAKKPDWPIVPYVERSADKYEKHNEKAPEDKK